MSERADKMSCPRCGEPMRPGVAVVKMKPEWLPTLAGVSPNFYQHLWFVPVDTTNAAAVQSATIDGTGEMILQVAQAGTARHCKSCGTVVLLKEQH